MANVILYHTDGCHLCEQAHEMLLAHADVDNIELRDIIDDVSWVNLYQVRIPVVTVASDCSTRVVCEADLGWPFDEHAITDFLKQYGSN
ncbi:glutaredoxin family protein [Pseudoalteromonas sp. SSDWG2]|uniref:glutaredoxin family protein n=1 Tax=Pseudoalteromonas sp. SSDWG2 TaxID=3139391 RepID=UPI003BAD6D25